MTARLEFSKVTEAVTLISQQGVPDAIYEEVNRYFTPKQITQLLMAIIAINAWNRISITTQIRPSSCQIEAAA
ncbi:MAG: hypothetical protein AAFQ57_07590 [Cyanobacteria bacterium J06626_14]